MEDRRISTMTARGWTGEGCARLIVPPLQELIFMRREKITWIPNVLTLRYLKFFPARSSQRDAEGSPKIARK
jgi:hypothetical protein